MAGADTLAGAGHAIRVPALVHPQTGDAAGGSGTFRADLQALPRTLLDKQVITSETFTALLLMAVASTLLTVPVVAPMLARMKVVVARLS